MFLDLTKTIGFFALTGLRVQSDLHRGHPHHHGLFINDKIVVYDRVRENLGRFRKMPLASAHRSQHQRDADARTVATNIGLFLAIAPLALFGGAALHEFAVVLLFGLVLATSSSIFIAAPILLNLGERRFGAQRPSGQVTGLPMLATADARAVE